MKFLEIWFNESSPLWEANYLIANDYINKEGVLEQWVTSCYDISIKNDTSNVIFSHIYDARIDSGKIKQIYIYEKKK